MKILINALLYAFLVLATANVFGQKTNISEPIDPIKTYKIELYDGSTFIGKISQKDSVHLVMITSLIPKLEIPILKIKTIEIIDESNFRSGVYWFPNPHATRYLYAPSAFNIKKGEGYYQNTWLFNTWLFFNSFNVGITDNISIGGGLEVFSTFAFRDPILFITPKVGFEVTEKFHAGGGVLFARLPGVTLGTIFGTGTYGSKDHNLTTSLGWGFVEGEFSQRPIITISGMTRVSKRVALVTENWLIPTDSYYGVFSYGARFLGEKTAFDLAFVNNPDIAQEILIGIPFVSFTLKF